jgi:hypothetical protein
MPTSSPLKSQVVPVAVPGVPAPPDIVSPRMTLPLVTGVVPPAEATPVVNTTNSRASQAALPKDANVVLIVISWKIKVISVVQYSNYQY